MITLKEFLESQNIKRRDYNEWVAYFKQQVGENIALDVLKLSDLGIAVHDVHPFYDYYQSLDFFYDLREVFISDMEKILTKLLNGQQVIDAGCATGLDVTLLALKFPQLNFIGYDNEPNHIQKAKNRTKNISNVQFYHFNHNANDTMPLADIIYTKMSHGHSDIFDYEEFIRQICKRIKPQGKYIFAVHNDPNIISRSKPLEREGITLDNITRLLLPKAGWEAFNYHFKKE